MHFYGIWSHFEAFRGGYNNLGGGNFIFKNNIFLRGALTTFSAGKRGGAAFF
jgi:hypothetical protein